MKENKKYNILKILGLLFIWQLIFGAAFISLVYFLRHQAVIASKNEAVFKFQYPEMFWIFLILIPFFIGAFFVLFWKNKKIALFSNSSFKAGVLPNISNWSIFLKLFFFLNVIIFSTVALANPIFGKANSKAKNSGIEIIVALDVSNSMLADDIAGGYTRLDIAKKGIEELLNNLHGDKIGFVIFAGDAYIQMPLTSDYDGAKVFLDPIDPSMISKQGTNIAAAINTSMDAFDDSKTSKTIILLTDGEAHDQGGIEMAKKAKEKGILVSTIGMGTATGGMVPDYVNGKFEGYKKDDRGDFVVTKINPGLIQNLAVSGGGTSTIATGISLDLSSQLAHVNSMEHKIIDSSEFQVGVSRYKVFLFIAFLSFIGFIIVSQFNLIKK